MHSVREMTPRDQHTFRRVLLLAAGIVLVLSACLVLFGWQNNIMVFKTVLPHLTPMNPMSALCFITLGLCCLALGLRRLPLWIKNSLVIVSTLLMVAVGGLMMLHYLFHIDAHIDRLLFEQKLSVNRMAPSTAVCFLLTGWALFISQFYRAQRVAVRILAAIIIFIATYTLIGYAYGVQPVYGVAALNPMALHVAVLFILAAVVIISTTIERIVLYITPALMTMYIVLTAIFMTLSVYSFRTFAHLNANNLQVQQNYRQQRDVDRLRTAMVDAETGQRGYILTGKDAYLQPYKDASGRADADLRSVLALPTEIISPAAKQQLRQLVAQKLAELQQTIALRQSNDLAAALKVVENDSGMAYMDKIRTILNSGDTSIQRQIQLSSQLAMTQNSKTLLLLSISTASILGLLLTSMYLLQANLKRQHDAAVAAAADQERTRKENHHLEAEASDRLMELEAVKASLEVEVASRTAELNTELERTQKLNSFMIDRELRIKDLKEEIAVLKAKYRR